MRVVTLAVFVCGVLAAGFPIARAEQAGSRSDGAVRGTERPDAATPTAAAAAVQTYCAACHNGVTKSPSGQRLDVFDAAAIAENPDVWSRAYRQMQAGTMPPVGAPRPDRATNERVLKAIDTALSAHEAPPAEPDGAVLAARLAGLLWNDVPDALLQRDATRGQLTDAAVLQRQVKRMLADERAQAFVTRFFVPWLGLDQLSKAEPNPRLFPSYTASLRDAMVKETELFILSQLRDDRDPIELWRANYSFVNGELARHYGIPNVTGETFRRITLPSPERAGLLGQASILMVTSRHDPKADATYTSPASRSVWVRMHFLGAANPNPFPNAAPVKPELPITPQTRALPQEPCVNCHRNFFPLGYALENFDPIGRWRTMDQIGPVDASGSFVDGSPTNGVVQLRNVLLQYPDAFRTSITERLVAYASARPVTPQKTTPDGFVRARQVLLHTPDTTWSALIAGIVRAGRL